MASYYRQATSFDEKPPETDHESLSSTTRHSQQPSKKPSAEQLQTTDPDVEKGIPTVDPTQDTDEKVPATEVKSEDPNIVDWEGEDDPARPLNWSTKRKWFNMAIVSAITFLTPLASSMVAPGVPLILRDFNSSSFTIGSFIVSIYVLGYALGPLVIAPLSEVYGRVPVYHTCNVLFTIWTLACALAPDVGSLLFFRLCAGIAGSCPITIGGGTISDCFSQAQRGGAMALFALGPLMGPVIGPVAGGYLTQASGWRWVFRVLTIAVSSMELHQTNALTNTQGGVMTIAGILFLRETYEPVLLERKTKKLKKETGNQELKSKLDPGISTKDYFIRAIVRPTKMLLFSPVILIFSTYMAIVYGVSFHVCSSQPEIWRLVETLQHSPPSPLLLWSPLMPSTGSMQKLTCCPVSVLALHHVDIGFRRQIPFQPG